MKAVEFLKITFDANKEWNVRPPVICADGYTVSIQGGTPSHYCVPRDACNEYLKVELGFPSVLDYELEEFAETPNTTDTVFGYVPIDVVERVIEKHGGIIDKVNPK